MRRPPRISTSAREVALLGPSALPDLDRGPWELEIGFGKGRYLLQQAEARPDTRFLGLEVAAEYYRKVRDRARRRGLDNLTLVHGEALYLLATTLPRGFAETVHVYHPDPWPKTRHQRRRLFDPTTVDLVVGALAPGGRLLFGTDYLEYGEKVAGLLAAHPALLVRRLDEWPGGPRTHYEDRFLSEGQPILRLEATRRAEEAPCLHPAGRRDLLVAWPGPANDETPPS